MDAIQALNGTTVSDMKVGRCVVMLSDFEGWRELSRWDVFCPSRAIASRKSLSGCVFPVE